MTEIQIIKTMNIQILFRIRDYVLRILSGIFVIHIWP